MQISDHRYLEKVFKNLRKKLNIVEKAPIIGIEALKTNVWTWGLFMSTPMKAAIHFGPNDVEILGSMQERKLRGTSEFIRYHAKIHIGS